MPWQRLNEADLAAVLVLSERAESLPWSEIRWQQTLQTDDCWGRYEGDALVALCALGQAGDWLELNQILVAPALQGRGEGRRLLAWVLDQARQQHCERLVLEVRASNTRAIHLYERAGFVLDGRRKGYYPLREALPGQPLQADDFEDALLMSHDLNSPHDLS
ncbi:hypothetical protein BFW38_14185 [Terasakiispira papahanaumokuakeensis]|uniref:N-acetyltransferase domain-containing protein n=1 Tax=Terasakiispira papahanaumokuakeensis TaxID=197479 RepID=A0A1E2VES3_9GAMM|nr:hypothetical protein BFW38_14185 [Terasakiispira papahanaumokuakeensis]